MIDSLAVRYGWPLHDILALRLSVVRSLFDAATVNEEERSGK